jgi:hypothetical protein
MSGTVLGFIAFAVVFVTGFLWFRRIHAVSLPEDRRGFVAAMLMGLALGITALASGAGWLGGVPAGLAIFLSTFFAFTVAISAQKGGAGAFQLGQPLPDFSAPDQDGRPFQLSSLAGQPVLLKFFRGHW